MKWKQIPRWLRDTISVVVAMSVLLAIYDAFFAKHVNWALVPLQIVVAFLAVGVWSFSSYQSQQKRQLAEAQKKAAAEKRQQQRQEQQVLAAKKAAVARQCNLARNQAHQQHRHE